MEWGRRVGDDAVDEFGYVRTAVLDGDAVALQDPDGMAREAAQQRCRAQTVIADLPQRCPPGRLALGTAPDQMRIRHICRHFECEGARSTAN
jgi:hypothetical protein